MARTGSRPDPQEVAQLYRLGLTLKQIAENLDNTFWVTRQAALEAGVEMRGRGRKVSDERIVKAFKAHGTIAGAAKALKLDRQTVRKRVKAAGLETIRGCPRTYEINEEFFSTYSAAACYWAGFIAADGGLVLSKRAHRIQLTLGLGDWDHLEMFKLCAGSTVPVREVTCDGIREAYLSISCRRWWDDLVERFNLAPAKSLILKPPPGEMPERMRWHYLRGYFDGDGGGTQAPRQISYHGTREMMEWVRDHIGSHHSVHPPHSIWRLVVSGDVMRRAVRLMYVGSKLVTRLARKYNHFVAVGMLKREPEVTQTRSRKMADKTHFELNVHWKQGDDFQRHLDKAGGHVVQALREWADSMSESAEALRVLAGDLEGQQVTGQGDTHHIGIVVSGADEKILKRIGAVPGVRLADYDADEQE